MYKGQKVFINQKFENSKVEIGYYLLFPKADIGHIIKSVLWKIRAYGRFRSYVIRSNLSIL